MNTRVLYILLKEDWDDTVTYGIYDDPARLLADYALVIEAEGPENIVIKKMTANTLNGVFDEFGFQEANSNGEDSDLLKIIMEKMSEYNPWTAIPAEDVYKAFGISEENLIGYEDVELE